MGVYYRKSLKPGVVHLVVGYIIDHYIQRYITEELFIVFLVILLAEV